MSACHQLWAHRAIGRTGNLAVGILMLCGGLFLLWQGVPGFMAWFLVIAALGILALDRVRERIWRSYYQGLDNMRSAVTATVDVHGVDQQSDTGEESLRWAQFQHYVLAKDYIILVVDSQRFVALPNSAMKTAGNYNQIEELVKENTKRLRGRLI